MDDVKGVVGVRHTYDGITLFEFGVGWDVGPSRPVGSEVDTDTRDFGKLGSHLDDPGLSATDDWEEGGRTRYQNHILHPRLSSLVHREILYSRAH